MPQMIIQILYAILIIEQIDSLIIISVILSLISSCTVIFSWCFSLIHDDQFILTQYVLKVTFQPNMSMTMHGSSDSINITDSDLKLYTSNITKYRGLKRALRRSLALSLGINASKLEIGYIDIINEEYGGCNIHIIHFIAQNNRENCKAFLLNSYSGKCEKIAMEIQRIYHLNIDIVVRLKLTKEQEPPKLHPEMNKLASALVSEMLVVLEDDKSNGKLTEKKNSTDLLEMALRNHIAQHHINDEFESQYTQKSQMRASIVNSMTTNHPSVVKCNDDDPQYQGHIINKLTTLTELSEILEDVELSQELEMEEGSFVM